MYQSHRENIFMASTSVLCREIYCIVSLSQRVRVSRSPLVAVAIN